MSLRQQSIVAVASGGALSLVSDVVRLGVMMVMARLLMPEDFGNAGLALSALFWVGALGFENFAPNYCAIAGRDRSAPICCSD